MRDLRGELRDLKLRVARLERHGEREPAAAATLPIAEPAPPIEILSLSDSVATFGRALLGIAGAYMLRALTEIGVMSKTVGVAAGLAYAVLWLWLASRTNPKKKLAIAVNASTSIVILAPLVWEATLRLGVLSTWTAAAIVAGFALAAQALVWRKRLRIISGLAPFAAAVIAMVLLPGTHDLLPFVIALLAIAAGAEFAALSDRAPGSRWVIAAIADFAIFSMAWLLRRPGGLPENYAPAPLDGVLAAQILMVLIYITSAVADTLVRNSAFSIPRIIQTGVALLLGLGGIYAVANQDPAVVAMLGLAALLGAVSCYAISFMILGGRHSRNGNAAVYAWFGFFLTLGAGTLLLPTLGRVAAWILLAVAVGWAQRYLIWSGVQLQDAGFLLIAAAVSGSWEASRSQLFGDGSSPFPGLAIVLLMVATALCYLPTHRVPDLSRKQRVAIAAIGANFTWLAAGAASHVLIAGLARLGVHVPSTTIGTAVLICLSLALAVAGAQWHRREMIWVVYGTMTLGAFKMATMDFANATTLPLVVSLLFYGSALILLPRILGRDKA